MLQEYSAAAKHSTKAAETVLEYATSNFVHHLKSAFIVPLCDDEIARAALVHDDAIVSQVGVYSVEW